MPLLSYICIAYYNYVCIAYCSIDWSELLHYNRYIIGNARAMDMRKFQIPKNPPTTSKTVRFPNDVIEQVESAIRGTNCTFSNFIVEATRVALESLEEDSDIEE